LIAQLVRRVIIARIAFTLIIPRKVADQGKCRVKPEYGTGRVLPEEHTGAQACRRAPQSRNDG
jgi:hypothetical protein